MQKRIRMGKMVKKDPLWSRILCYSLILAKRRPICISWDLDYHFCSDWFVTDFKFDLYAFERCFAVLPRNCLHSSDLSSLVWKMTKWVQLLYNGFFSSLCVLTVDNSFSFPNYGRSFVRLNSGSKKDFFQYLVTLLEFLLEIYLFALFLFAFLLRASFEIKAL